MTSSPTPATWTTCRTWPSSTRATAFVQGDICDAAAVAAADAGARRRHHRQLRRRDARRPLDHGRRTPSSRPTSTAPTCCWRRRASSGSSAITRSATDEVYGAVPEGSLSGDRPAGAAQPLLRQQGRRRSDGLAYYVTYGLPVTHHARLQQHRPLPVPGEGGAAVRHQRASTTSRCRSTATAGRCATTSTCSTTAQASTLVLQRGATGRDLQRRHGQRDAQHRAWRRCCSSARQAATA